MAKSFKVMTRETWYLERPFARTKIAEKMSNM